MTPRMVGVKPLYRVFSPSSRDIRMKTCTMLLYLAWGHGGGQTCAGQSLGCSFRVDLLVIHSVLSASGSSEGMEDGFWVFLEQLF